LIVNALKDLFAVVLDRAGPERARRLKLKAFWPAIAGPALASRARAELNGDEVVLLVEDRRWRLEIERMEPVLRQRLGAAIGAVGRVVVKEAPAPAARRPAAPAPSPPPGPPSPELAGAAARVADPALRSRLVEIASRYLQAAARRDDT